MNACDRFVDRLYDEDVRLALARGDQLPQDMATHASGCTDCQRAWDDARADVRIFGALFETAPTNLEQRASRAARAALPMRTQAPLIDWAPAATWAVIAAALAGGALSLLGPGLTPLWQGSIVVAAAATALSVEAARQGLEGEA